MKKVLSILIVLAMTGVASAFTPIEFGNGKYLEIFYEGQFGATYRDVGSGPDQEDYTTDMNFLRNRVGFIGTYFNWLSFYVQMAYDEESNSTPFYIDLSDSDKDFYILDAQIRFTPNKYVNGYIGKMKHNLTRENLEASFTSLSIEKSAFWNTPYKTSRDIGIAVWGGFFENKIQYRLDVMEGRVNTEGSPAPSSNFRYTGRIQLSMLDPETEYNLAGTYLGSQEVLTIGAAYQYEPSAVYGDVAGYGSTKDYSAYSADMFFEYLTWAGMFTVSAAYLDIEMFDAYTKIDPDEGVLGLNGQKNGYNVKLGYMPPVIVNEGRFQLYGRFDSFEFANLPNNDVTFSNQVVQRLAVGLNFYMLGENLKLTGEYSRTDFDQEDSNDPMYRDYDSFDLYLQARF
ncbi:MAG: porin [Deferribacteraceae bacterium]|jgi:hypothetical protein|nr:porin [Deferribacteraceae bacterium]